MLEPWAQRISETSNGRIEVKIFPSMALGGKPQELYQQVRDGVVDIVWTLPGYTPDMFPHTEVFELPTVRKGVVEGALVPFEIFLPMELADLTKYSLVGGNNESFGTSTFLFAMNKNRYDPLPDDLEKVMWRSAFSPISSRPFWDGITGPFIFPVSRPILPRLLAG